MAENAADIVTVDQWHQSIDSLFFRTKTGSLNWYSLAEIFVNLYNEDCEDLAVENRILQDGFGFLRTQTLKINPKVYQYMTQPNVKIHHTIDLVNCGRSSYAAVQHIADNLGDVLVSNFPIVVYVDKETRKSAPLPEYFRKAVKKTIPLNRFTFKAHVCSLKYFQMKVTVVYTDLDNYGHATQTSYIRHVFNAFVAAAESRALGNISVEDIFSAQELRFSFEAESKLGSSYIVKVWNDKSSGLHAQIVAEVNHEKIIFQAFVAVVSGPRKQAKL
ncbi:uncharacterized protein LOC117122904 [Anneissia japonica]|uniref:uncharacterized protein LOC117122904 n=1 Tax=Anneissia japonica TaxID=1529436 RepID=UPI0014258FFE|nr:uncharacterized protein LOC117122904 [Anneissia japonica]XP_033124569.1 uncharacterized protein LOC117122904 [Anneissia japonica]XP_033124571.1 uncharacterized protein LOC117122904 [Anneissia japonica]